MKAMDSTGPGLKCQFDYCQAVLTSGSSFTSLCLDVSLEAGRWDLECQVPGLRLFSKKLGSHRGLWAPQGLGSGNWPQAPVFCHILILC